MWNLRGTLLLSLALHFIALAIVYALNQPLPAYDLQHDAIIVYEGKLGVETKARPTPRRAAPLGKLAPSLEDAPVEAPPSSDAGEEGTSAIQISPKYPPLSRTLGEEGTVTFALEIDREGKVTDAEIVESSGYERLDQAAQEAVEAARFAPTMKEGVAVIARKTFRVEFRLTTKPQKKP